MNHQALDTTPLIDWNAVKDNLKDAKAYFIVKEFFFAKAIFIVVILNILNGERCTLKGAKIKNLALTEGGGVFKKVGALENPPPQCFGLWSTFQILSSNN